MCWDFSSDEDAMHTLRPHERPPGPPRARDERRDAVPSASTDLGRPRCSCQDIRSLATDISRQGMPSRLTNWSVSSRNPPTQADAYAPKPPGVHTPPNRICANTIPSHQGPPDEALQMSPGFPGDCA